MRCIVILGGYGNFGSRIAAELAHEPNVRVIVAGRDASKAEHLTASLGGTTEPLAIDHQKDDLTEQLQHIGATVVVHTAGPFQGQDYEVARACIAAGCHYIDLADGRDFVANIGLLDSEARRREVLVVSGASSLPALSSAVVDAYRDRFSKLKSIDCAISAGAKPPGIATMRGVLSYVGKPFQRLEIGAWRTVFGWQDIIAQRFPKPIGRRWLAGCDVPDLALFPQRYPDIESAIFRAGVGFASTTLAMWLLSWCVRFGLIRNLARHADLLHGSANIIQSLGSKWSAMRVHVSGLGRQQERRQFTWNLLAGDDHGPYIPTFPAIALARKLVRDEVSIRGAMPCMGLLTVDEILAVGRDLNLRVIETD